MPDKIRWGVLGTANIALKKVIPGMQKSERCIIAAIASRDLNKAREAASTASILRAYGSYEELLADPNIDAIYNPLPNHLHVPWSIRAAEAGKHVLCEKPIALNAGEVLRLMEVRERTGVKIGEAFMVRTHPQWLRARAIVREGGIGDLRAVVGSYSYFNRDPKNIRNIVEWGGGALMDIGCYPIVTSRFLYGAEPLRVAGLIDRDPEMGVDRLTSVMLEFPTGHAVFTCSTQVVPHQRLQILGTKGRIEMEIPFNAPPDRPTRILVDSTGDLFGAGIRFEEFPVCDQYGIQGDLFSKAILEGGEVPTPLEESVRNMAVIDAVFRSAASGGWEEPSVSPAP